MNSDDFTSEDQGEEQSQFVDVYGDQFARARKNALPAYQRIIHTRPVTFTCMKCNQTVTQQRYPGRTPLYCSDICAGEAERAKTAERTRRYRERKATQQKASQGEM